MQFFRKFVVILACLLALMGMVATVSAAGSYTTIRWTNIYASPGGASTGKALAPNTTVTMIGENAAGNWMQIQSSDGDGWIPANAVKSADGSTPAPATSGSRTTRWTDLYNGPNGQRSGTALAPNTAVTVVSNNGQWVQVQSAQGNGWVPANAVSGAGAPAAPAPTTPASPPANNSNNGNSANADDVTIRYLSNPNEILGVFPVRAFNGQQLYNNMKKLQTNLEAMRNSLGGAKNGDSNACNAYANAYRNVMASGVFYEDVPPAWANADARYLVAFIYALDRTRPAYLSCVDAGRVDNFNYGLAFQSIEQALSALNPGIDSAESILGISQ